MHRIHVATHDRENLDIPVSERPHQACRIAERNFGKCPVFDQGHIQPFAGTTVGRIHKRYRVSSRRCDKCSHVETIFIALDQGQADGTKESTGSLPSHSLPARPTCPT
jgi:hypothetical protein